MDYNQTDLFKQIEPPQGVNEMLESLQQIHVELTEILTQLSD